MVPRFGPIDPRPLAPLAAVLLALPAPALAAPATPTAEPAYAAWSG